MNAHGGYCPHLEKLVEPRRHGEHRMNILMGTSIDRVSNEAQLATYCGNDIEDEAKLRAKLTAYGLIPKKVEVVVARMVYGKTFREIAVDLGYQNAAVASSQYSKALVVLKKNGYK